MSKERVSAAVPAFGDLSWLASLSDEQFSLVKRRMAELSSVQAAKTLAVRGEGKNGGSASQPSVGNLSWVTGVSKKRWPLVKKRYGELVDMAFQSSIKAALRFGIMQEDETLTTALGLEIMQEIVEDEKLPKEVRSLFRKEIKEAKAELKAKIGSVW